MAKAATSCTFCRFPFESARTLFVGVELEALDQRVAVGAVVPAAQPREELERLGAVSDGHRNGSPATYATRRWAATGSRHASTPNSSARPRVGRCRPSSSRIVVVLPAPFGPRIPVDLARLDRRSSASSASVVP